MKVEILPILTHTKREEERKFQFGVKNYCTDRQFDE